MRTPAPLFALSALCALLPAQDAVSPFRFVPADCSLVARIAGPGKWQRQFAKTQVTKLLQGQAMAPLQAMLTEGMREAMDEMQKEGRMDPELVESLLRDYAGDVVIAMHLDLDGLTESMQTGETPPIGVVIALTPDPSYDLAKLAQAIDKAAEGKDDGTLRDLKVGELRLRTMADEDGEGRSTVPQLVDGHLVFLAGNDLETFAGKVFAKDARFAGATSDAPLHVHARLDAFVEKILGVVEEQMGAMGAPFDVAQLLRDVGFSSLQSLDLTVAAEGKHTDLRVQLGMREGERGLFGMFAGSNNLAKVLRLIPAGTEAFSVSSFRSGELFGLVGKIWQSLGDAVPMTWEDAMRSATEALKIRLKEDLFDHLGDETLMVEDPAAESEFLEDDTFSQFHGTCYAFTLRDGKALATSLETMLRARGMHASRKTEEYQGTKVHRLPIAGIVVVEYAVTDDLLLVGVGGKESTGRALRSVLDARSKNDGGLAPAMKARVDALPAGWSGLGTMRLSGPLRAMADLAELELGDDPDAATALSVMKGIAAELQRLEIDHLLFANYADAKGIALHVRW